MMSVENEAMWRRFWGVRLNPCCGVEFAIVVGLSVPAGVALPYESGGTLTSGRYELEWLGWSSERGPMLAVSTWTVSKNLDEPPECPACQWEDWSVNARGLKPAGRLVPYVALPVPFPEGSASDATEDDLHAFKDRELQQFLRCLPRVHEAMVTLKVEWQILDRSHLGMSKLLTFLMGGNPTRGSDARTASLRRCQFVTSMPFMAMLQRHRNIDELAPFLDAEISPVGFLAESLECTERLVRLLGKGSVNGLSADQQDNMCRDRKEMVLFLENLPDGFLERVIRGDRGHPSFEDVLELARTASCILLSDHCDESRHDLRVLARSVGSVSGSGYAWLKNGAACLRHVTDLAREMQEELLRPAREVGGSGWSRRDEDFFMGLMAGMGMARLLRASDRHLDGFVHDAYHGTRPEVDDRAHGATWPVPSDEEMLFSGRTLRFLRSERELRRESRNLGHCVDTYGEACRTGTCAILSMGEWKEGQWFSTSTAEIRVTECGDDIRVRQHLGLRNARPSDEDAEALCSWRGDVQNGRITLDLRYLVQSSKATNETPTDVMTYLLGKTWSSPEAHAWRWDRWKRILEVRHASFLEFVEDMTARAPERFGHVRSVEAVSFARDMERRMRLPEMDAA